MHVTFEIHRLLILELLTMNNWVNGQLHEAFILYKSSIKRLAFALQFATYINIHNLTFQ